jgi:hypothetical protein
MAAQSENERNKALADEYYKAGVQGHLELRGISASRRHSNRAQLPPWGGRHVGAAFFRDHLLQGVADCVRIRTVQLRQRRCRGWPVCGGIQHRRHRDRRGSQDR